MYIYLPLPPHNGPNLMCFMTYISPPPPPPFSSSFFSFHLMLPMGEGKNQMPPKPSSLYSGDEKGEDQRIMIMDGEDREDTCNATSSSSSIVSNGSISSSSSEMADDASSPSTSCSSSSLPSSTGDLYDLSELMAQLPIKRGLSKFYEGKSQSFTSLSRVTSTEDLPKKETPYRIRKMKATSKSYGGGLDSYKSYTLPKPTISKKASRGSSSSFSFPSRRGSFVNSCRSPLSPVQKNLGCVRPS